MSRRFEETPAQLLTKPEIARAVIAGWMNGCPAKDVPFLKPEHFHDERDQALWAAARDLEAEGIPAEFPTLVARVMRTASVDHTDWRDYCMTVLAGSEYASTSSFQDNARIVYENWRRLQLYREHVRKANRALNISLPLPAEFQADFQMRPHIKKRWTVAELLEAEFAEPAGPWPGIIPVGLTVIGARPKYGKSLLMMQVSAAVGTGGMLFGQSVEASRVLYYALEDSPQRLKERVSRLQIPTHAEIDFARDIKPLHLGGLADVEAAARSYGLIVLDTISRAVPGQDLNREAALYGDLLGRLQTVALEQEMSIVTVVHTRKPNGMDRDPIDDVLGSTQMTAAADCVLAIYRGAGRSQLKGRARDTEDIDLTIEFDPATVSWQLVGKTEDVRQTESESEILECIKELGKAKASTVAETLGAQRSNTSNRLQRLCERGKLLRQVVDGISYYALSDPGGER